MEKARVLLDTNILISGLVFTKGNGHKILRLIEDRHITLVIPETVLMEARKVLMEKFPGFERLLDLFLGRIELETIPLSHILSTLKTYTAKVRDSKDAPIYVAIALTKPDHVVTGDKILRLDLRRALEIIGNTKVCSSKEFLDEFQK